MGRRPCPVALLCWSGNAVMRAQTQAATQLLLSLLHVHTPKRDCQAIHLGVDILVCAGAASCLRASTPQAIIVSVDMIVTGKLLQNCQ